MTFKDKPKRDGGKTFSRDKKPKGPGKPAAEREKKPVEAKAAPVQEAVMGTKPERISKIMARAGVASRRDIERMIMEGRVSLNGVKLDTPVMNATLSDKIEVDGMPIRGAERTRLWLYHKPAGLVTTNSDPEGRPTVFDNLPGELPRVLSIGRLDINTEGLLLLTNDGGLSRVLELPTTGWLRRYRVRAHGEVDQAALDKLKEGIAVDGVLYGAIDATLDRTQGHNVWITMGLREGKNREIKNVLGALGLEVNRLIRISYGPFQLGDLPEGKVLEVRGRMLRDQLGPRLIEQSGANFDAPIYDAPVAEDEEENTPKRAPRSEWAKSDAPEGKPRFDRAAGKPEDRREKALGRLDTKRGDKPAGKFGGKPAGKFGAKTRGEEDGEEQGRSGSFLPARKRKACSRSHPPRRKRAATSSGMPIPRASGSVRIPRAKRKAVVDVATARAVERALEIAAGNPSVTARSVTNHVNREIARVATVLAARRASEIAPHAVENRLATVRSVTSHVRRVIARAATAHAARRASEIAQHVVRNLSVSVRSATNPAKTVIAHAATGLSVTSQEAQNRVENPAAGPHRASLLLENRVNVANVRVFQARAKAPVAVAAPAAANRAAKARVANLLVAGE
ncbi:ribosomal large subunit pseudouridine synthase B [Agrobacterium tumefaciens LBA4213 (Ach5)]|nr:ribosomal large subunit pseudouridine synthase B [Agrobacterium tumefaciens LBA4213 (Ach5)]